MEPARYLDDAVQILCVLEDDVRAPRLLRRDPRPRSAHYPSGGCQRAVGISVRLAAFHLDKLVDDGLLDPTTAARRDADGARRPAKRYRITDAAIELSLPPRPHDVLATILAQSTATGGERRRSPASPARSSSAKPARGMPCGAPDRARRPRLRTGATGRTTLQRNCPFRVVQRA